MGGGRLLFWEFASYGPQHNFEKVIYNHSGTIMHPPGTRIPWPPKTKRSCGFSETGNMTHGVGVKRNTSLQDASTIILNHSIDSHELSVKTYLKYP